MKSNLTHDRISLDYPFFIIVIDYNNWLYSKMKTDKYAVQRVITNNQQGTLPQHQNQHHIGSLKALISTFGLTKIRAVSLSLNISMTNVIRKPII